jgi:hypothetical protein
MRDAVLTAAGDGQPRVRHPGDGDAELARRGLCAERRRRVRDVLVHERHPDVVLRRAWALPSSRHTSLAHACTQRNGIPQDLNNNAPDPTGWPRPSAYFPANGCDPRAFFNPQRMILNTNLCGAWAGNAQVYNSTGCSGSCVDMIGKASNFDNAYWEISYLKTFTAAGNASATATGTGAGAGAATTGGATGTGGAATTTTQGGVATAGPASGARRLEAASWTAGVLLVAGVAAAFS